MYPRDASLEPYIRKVIMIKDVHDGDTLTAVLDLGFRITATLKMRVNRIDTPELPSKAGKAATEHLIFLLEEVTHVQTFKDPVDKYGRWLAEFYAGEMNINDQMVKDGYARYYDGGKK